MYMYQFPQQEKNTQPCTIAAPNLHWVFAEPGFELVSHMQLKASVSRHYTYCSQHLKVLVTLVYL